jgi:hypothetical protein
MQRAVSIVSMAKSRKLLCEGKTGCAYRVLAGKFIELLIDLNTDNELEEQR